MMGRGGGRGNLGAGVEVREGRKKIRRKKGSWLRRRKTREGRRRWT